MKSRRFASIGLAYRRCSQVAGALGVFACLHLAGARAARAGADVWTSHGPEGHSVRSVAIDSADPATLYAGGDGFWKSTNGGASWSAISFGGSSPVAIDPTTPTTVYVGSNGSGLWKSTNGGDGWAAINTGLTTSLSTVPRRRWTSRTSRSSTRRTGGSSIAR